MRHSLASLFLILAFLLTLAACDGDTPATPGGVPSVAPALTQVPTPAASPTVTSVPRLKKGDEADVLRALEQLREDTLAWEEDALFIMLANVKPGQEGRLLGMALSDPDLSDSTPGAKGRNWVLLAASSSAEGVVVFDLDGTKLDLVTEGRVSAPLLSQLTGPNLPGVAMSDIDVSGLIAYDAIKAKAGEIGSAPSTSLALIAPARLGLASLFGEGESPPELVYQLFSPEPEPRVIFFDAMTGEQVGEDAP